MSILDGLFQNRKHVRHDVEDDDTDPRSHTVVIPKQQPLPAGRGEGWDAAKSDDPWGGDLSGEPAEPSGPLADAPTQSPRPQPPVPPKPRPRPPTSAPEENDTVIRTVGSPPSAGRVVAVLVGLEGPLENEVYRVFEGENVLGREGKPEPFPNTPDTKTISREHAVLRVAGEHFLIEPSNPKNATFVNGQLVDERSLVQHGDRIGLGAVRTATFVLLVVPTTS